MTRNQILPCQRWKAEFVPTARCLKGMNPHSLWASRPSVSEVASPQENNHRFYRFGQRPSTSPLVMPA